MMQKQKLFLKFMKKSIFVELNSTKLKPSHDNLLFIKKYVYSEYLPTSLFNCKNFDQ